MSKNGIIGSKDMNIFLRLLIRVIKMLSEEYTNLYPTPPSPPSTNVSEYLFLSHSHLQWISSLRKEIGNLIDTEWYHIIFICISMITFILFYFLWLLVRVYTNMFIFKAFVIQDFEHPQKLTEYLNELPPIWPSSQPHNHQPLEILPRWYLHLLSLL